MEKEFVPYELAVKLKELGFDEPCMYAWCITPKHRIEYKGKMYLKTDGNPFGGFYEGKSFNGKYSPNKSNIQCSAPTFSQSFRWFREKYNLECHIKSLYEQRENKGFYFGIDDYTNRDFYSKPYYSYEEAELECLRRLIELTNEQQIRKIS